MTEVETMENLSLDKEESPSVLAKKHPLRQEWTYWFLNDHRNLEWEERLKAVSTFGTVEDFWALYNNIKMPSQLNFLCDYNVFKKEIAPKWEVPENLKGGRWLIPIEKKSPNYFDIIWLEILMAMIGEQFAEDQDLICGLVANVRTKGSKISVWTKDHTNDDGNLRIGHIIKAKLVSASPDKSRPIFGSMQYQDHDSCQSKTGSGVKAKFTINSMDDVVQRT